MSRLVFESIHRKQMFLREIVPLMTLNMILGHALEPILFMKNKKACQGFSNSSPIFLKMFLFPGKGDSQSSQILKLPIDCFSSSEAISDQKWWY